MQKLNTYYFIQGGNLVTRGKAVVMMNIEYQKNKINMMMKNEDELGSWPCIICMWFFLMCVYVCVGGAYIYMRVGWWHGRK